MRSAALLLLDASQSRVLHKPVDVDALLRVVTRYCD
jgi:hypothetical protein